MVTGHVFFSLCNTILTFHSENLASVLPSDSRETMNLQTGVQIQVGPSPETKFLSSTTHFRFLPLASSTSLQQDQEVKIL